ncbi:MAG: hypothetical protein LJE91_16140 [Gammaproteobacteria bacterium]|nr:hypothetical protein [Gammaproteobacteria bacterium]
MCRALLPSHAVAAILSSAPTLALGQATVTQPPYKPLEKTIGLVRPEIVLSLVVMNAKGATLDGTALMLTGAAGNASVFVDRPVRGWARTDERAAEATGNCLMEINAPREDTALARNNEEDYL